MVVSVDCHGTACAWDCATSACAARAKLAHKPGHAALCLDLGEYHHEACSHVHCHDNSQSASAPQVQTSGNPSRCYGHTGHMALQAARHKGWWPTACILMLVCMTLPCWHQTPWAVVQLSSPVL